MPLNKYYKGHGDEVMSSMKKKYGDKKGEEVFYATANKKGMKPKSHMPKGAHMKGDWGDIGAKRVAEGEAVGGFKQGSGAKKVSKK